VTDVTDTFRPTPAEPIGRPRPHDLSERELGFRPHRPVQWLSPAVLAITGIQVLLARIFGGYADKRELQAVLPATVHRRRQTDTGELWLDYVSDLGDGFDATYSVAGVLARPVLDLPAPEQTAGGDHSLTLPRGQLLIMGGDQVYPSASSRAYEDRLEGPYRSALPVAPEHPPTLFALPGNHDWYDGLPVLSL